MLRKGRKANNNNAVGSGGGGGAPSRSPTRDGWSHQPPTALSPAETRANLLYQCYDASVYAPSNATFLSPSSTSGGGKQRPSGVAGSYAVGAASGKASRTRRGGSIAGFNGTKRQSNAQATTITTANKQQQQFGSSESRATPPLIPAPPPVARGGDSYVNENTRLVVSDPLPYSSRQQQRDGNRGGDVSDYTSARREVMGAARGRDEVRYTLDLNGRRCSDSTPYSGAGMGRPRASSLPRTHEDVKEILPRLRPLRDVRHGGDLSRLRSPLPRHSVDHHGAVAGYALDSLRTTAPNGTMFADDTEKEKQREVLSAPPASSTMIPSSYSPRPVADQVRLLGRHNNRGSIHRSNAMATRAAGSPDTRILRQSPLSSGSDDDGFASASGPSALETTTAAAAAGPGNGRTASIEARRNVKGGAAAAVAAAIAQRGNTGLGETVRKKPVYDNSGANAKRSPYGAEAERPEHKGREARGEAVDADELFGSTQMLCSLRSGAERSDGNTADARPPPPAVPVTAPSSRMRNRDHSGAKCRENELPVYKFNVVLSSGKTATAPISLIAGSGCVQGMRPTMEDAHFAELNVTHVRGQPVSLLAVLDGHCGRRVADLGAKWLPHYVLHHAALGENNALALVESILQTDREIFHTLQSKSHGHHQHKAGNGSGRRRRDVDEEVFDEMTSGTNGGSTLIAAAVCGRMLYVACLGDARAVLYDGHTTIAMSEDHKPGNTDESRRIAKCGGFVQFGRVCGILAVSRALGDFEFKFQPSSSPDAAGEEKLSTTFPFGALRENDSSGSAAPSPSSHNHRFISNRDLMVSNIADVRQLHLTDASAFLLLACDGLWDVLSNEEATEFVRDFLCYTPDVCDPHIFSGAKSRPPPDVVQRVLNNCCQKLAEFAVDRGSMDNVSVMVLFFHDVVDTVARFIGRVPSPANVGEAISNASRQPHSLQGSGRSHPRKSVQSVFELTNKQLKVRNGRIVAQR
ncbi:protein phosphatase 2C-like protein [Leishmania mexicana MHOM/GT/2001/U1103]|uniref:Protein phosphatase 2C-like protein n=1 Tax=Leishmania mexicana (strain MHOM/GT/2001/U1103) TaxID=929439 RepID=E9APT5_LEIMU|nr:protein phosphatase 2C-like protein [Leishmania mexicana MHOM/GT/2001/U1103]CBZ24952.1 protein phosphatase 2C-like protein [Leishmania mexicana MHOM/GT/2001/U1103]